MQEGLARLMPPRSSVMMLTPLREKAHGCGGAAVRKAGVAAGAGSGPVRLVYAQTLLHTLDAPNPQANAQFVQSRHRCLEPGKQNGSKWGKGREGE